MKDIMDRLVSCPKNYKGKEDRPVLLVCGPHDCNLYMGDYKSPTYLVYY